MKSYISTILLLSLAKDSLAQAQTINNCPKETDTCAYGYSKFKLTDPNAPACWTKGYGVWKCTPKTGANCAGYGVIDITNCKPKPPIPPVDNCPKATDTCTSNGSTFNPNDNNAPQCWNLFEGKWNCAAKQVDGKCNPSINYVDVSQCKYDPKPPVPPIDNCPKANDTCTSNGATFKPSDKNAPQCWILDNYGGWSCAAKQVDGKCNPSINYVDVSQCKYPDPDPKPPVDECPKATEYCSSGGLTFAATDKLAPPCWNYSNEHWSCFSALANGSCDPNVKYTDIRKCNITPDPDPKPPVDYCPKVNDTCTSNGSTFNPNDKNAPPCWNLFEGKWSCAAKEVNGKCNGSIFFVDVTQCKYPDPDPKPPVDECPKANDTCTSNGSTFKPTDKNAPQCWFFDNYKGWSCAAKQVDGKCNPSINYVDVSQCKYEPVPPIPPVPECPKATDMCRSGGIILPANGENTPPCWHFANEQWSCFSALDSGVCDPNVNYVDIRKCGITPDPKPPVDYCPKVNDTCTSNGSTFNPNDNNAPQCWNLFEGKWNCAAKQVDGKCNPSINYVDVSQCKYDPKPPVPPIDNCPKANDTCTSNGSTFNPSDKDAPQCWFFDNYKGWSCAAKQVDGKCNPSINYVDVSQCKYDPKPPVPPIDNCPKANDTCTSNGSTFNPSDKDAPQCWFFDNYKGWSCAAKQVDGKCNPSINYVDVSQCKYDPKPPVPPIDNCPKANDTCTSNGATFKPSDKNAPQCWILDNYGGWSCAAKQVDGKCNPSINYVDVSQCKYPDPDPIPPVPECPKATDRCTNGGISVLPTDKGAPPCWNFSNGKWNCAAKEVNGQCNGSNFYVDVTQCKYDPKPPVPVPTCPLITDTCNLFFINYKPNNKYGPQCWSKKGDKWTCSYKKGKCVASLGQIDVTTCNYTPTPPTPSKCPTRNDKCYDDYGRSYSFTSYGAPKCWSKSSYGWKCRSPGYGTCNANEVDIQKCSSPY